MKRRIITATALVLFVALSIWLRLPSSATNLHGAPSEKLEKRVVTEGDVERTEYVDDKGRLTYARDKRWAALVKTRDAAANTVLEEYLDENGAPAPQSNGCCAVLRRHDADGRDVEITYLDAQGQPMDITSGYARVVKTYDGEGRLTSERYYDVEGQPAAVSNGSSGYRKEYIGEDLYRITYLGTDDRPVTIKSGYSALTRRLNADGKVVEEHYYGLDGSPRPTPQGEYGLEKTYDAEGRETGITYLGADGMPAMTRRGYAMVKKTYDEAGKLSAQMYFDPQGHPASTSSGSYGTRSVSGKTMPVNRDGSLRFELAHLLSLLPASSILFGLLACVLSALLSKRLNAALAVAYLLVIAYMTLLRRGESSGRGLNLDLFWSYRRAVTAVDVRWEIIDNIWLFVPLGAMLYRVFDNPWALLIPLMVSASVELAQYAFGLGLCELDDLFSNTLGGYVGYLTGWTLRPTPAPRPAPSSP